MNSKKKILVFCCENSAYKAFMAIDDESIKEIVKVVSLPCSGKIEVGLVLKCLENDYPGVLILCCPIDNCKYITGNVRARKRVEVIKQALKNAGVDESRVRIGFISSLDSHKFVNIVKEMKDSILKDDFK